MFFEEIQVGDQMLIPETRVEKEEMLAFARRYNPVPMHTDEEYAAAARAGQVTSSGLYTFLLIWCQYVTGDFGGAETIAGTDMRLKFTAPVFAGDVLHGVAEVLEKKERNAYNGTVRVGMDIYNQNGALVLRSETDTVVKRKSAENRAAEKEKREA